MRRRVFSTIIIAAISLLLVAICARLFVEHYRDRKLEILRIENNGSYSGPKGESRWTALYDGDKHLKMIIVVQADYDLFWARASSPGGNNVGDWTTDHTSDIIMYGRRITPSTWPALVYTPDEGKVIVHTISVADLQKILDQLSSLRGEALYDYIQTEVTPKYVSVK